MKVLGIDPSTTRMGFVVLDCEKGRAPVILYEGDSSHTNLKGNERKQKIAADLIDLLNRWRPDRVVMEGTILGRNTGDSSIKLLETIGVVRYLLAQYGYTVWSPKPSELKKFVTGNGGAQKNAIKASIIRRWGHTPKNHDTADAYGLAMMGAADMGLGGWRLTADEIATLGNMKVEHPHCN